MNFRQAQHILKMGGVGILPTDTIYGIVGRASDPRAVKRIYSLRRRNLKKPMIVLIAAPGDVRRFGVPFTASTKGILKKLWPGKVSVILPCRSGKFSYLHRGTRTLAFRLPRPARLRALIRATGPLVAPSANIEGKPPARTVREAEKYFGKKADFYVNGGRIAAKASTLVRVEKGKVVVLRRGAVKIKQRMMEQR